jgi:hypothetical protein
VRGLGEVTETGEGQMKARSALSSVSYMPVSSDSRVLSSIEGGGSSLVCTGTAGTMATAVDKSATKGSQLVDWDAQEAGI